MLMVELLPIWCKVGPSLVFCDVNNQLLQYHLLNTFSSTELLLYVYKCLI